MNRPGLLAFALFLASCSSIPRASLDTSVDDAGKAASDGELDAAADVVADISREAGGCVTDDDCADGEICDATHACVAGCSATRPCGDRLSCCAGTCVDTNSSADHCGGCFTTCSAAYATVACNGGVCAISQCINGFLDCDHAYGDGCEVKDKGKPTTPQAVRPRVGEYTGSFLTASTPKAQRPTFVWTPSTGGTCDGVTYDFELDDSCTPGDLASCSFTGPNKLTWSHLTSTSLTPDSPLAVSNQPPVGRRYYWRVRACDPSDGGGQCSDWSPVTYVEVGRVAQDYNGDGLSDTAASTPLGTAPLYVNVYLGIGGTPIRASAADAGAEFGADMVWVDINADGFADLVVGDPSAYAGEGALFIYMGSASPSGSPTPDNTVRWLAEKIGFAARLERVGDFNANGFADFAVSSRLTPASGPTIRIFDRADQVSNVHTFELGYQNAGDAFGSVMAAGDLNGDGIPDLAVGVPAQSQLVVFPGDRQFAGYVYKLVSTPVSALAPAGDADDDGFDDLAVCTGDGNVSLYRGAATLPPAPTWRSPSPDVGQVVALIAGGFDLGGDRIADFAAIYDRQAGAGAPYVAVFYGTKHDDPSLEKQWDGVQNDVAYGHSMVMLQDADGDGLGDIVVGDPEYQVNGTTVGALLWYQARPTAGPIAVGTSTQILGNVIAR